MEGRARAARASLDNRKQYANNVQGDGEDEKSSSMDDDGYCVGRSGRRLGVRWCPDVSSDTQYAVYWGTNDKDTAQPVYEPEVCMEKAIEILLKHFGGYTIQEAHGGWIDGEKVYTEYTLVIYLSDTTLDKVHAACDEMIEVFNQSAILIQATV